MCGILKIFKSQPKMFQIGPIIRCDLENNAIIIPTCMKISLHLKSQTTKVFLDISLPTIKTCNMHEHFRKLIKDISVIVHENKSDVTQIHGLWCSQMFLCYANTCICPPGWWPNSVRRTAEGYDSVTCNLLQAKWSIIWLNPSQSSVQSFVYVHESNLLSDLLGCTINLTTRLA